MRMPSEIDEFRTRAISRELSEGRLAYEVGMYEGCVPQLYWFVKPKDVKHNRAAFDSIVMPYHRRMKRAFAEGYSLLFTGDNGTGKTLFISYLLGRAVRRGMSIYYTTLLGLDRDLKMGFDNREAASALRSALASDFVAIDELKSEAKRDYIVSQLEAILKERYDDGYPTLLASNLDCEELCKAYGPTFESMIEGRYQQVSLEGGDFRKKLKSKMRSDMGFK